MVVQRGFFVFFLLVYCFEFYCFFFVFLRGGFQRGGFQRGGLVGSAETKSLTEVRQVLNDPAPDLIVVRATCFPKGEEGQEGRQDSSNPCPMYTRRGQAPLQATLTIVLTNYHNDSCLSFHNILIPRN